MTREEAIETVDSVDYFGMSTDHKVELSKAFVNKIYGDFKEEKLKIAENSLYRADKYNEVVDELIELKSRTCESCKHWDKDDSGYGFMLGYCNKDVGNSFTIDNATKHDFGCNKWEAKDAK